jgi:hypothetical protein
MNQNLAIRGLQILALGLALAACESNEIQHNGDLGITVVQFADAPVPEGLKLVERFYESHSREEAGWRYGHFEYVGQTQIKEACDYLLQRMPNHNWQLTADSASEPNVRQLQFKRGAYVVDYRLERIHGETHMVVDYDTKIEGR